MAPSLPATALRRWSWKKRLLIGFVVVAAVFFVLEVIVGVVMFTSMLRDYPPTTQPN